MHVGPKGVSAAWQLADSLQRATLGWLPVRAISSILTGETYVTEPANRSNEMSSSRKPESTTSPSSRRGLKAVAGVIDFPSNAGLTVLEQQRQESPRR